MTPSLCSQSLFALSLNAAISATAEIGFPAIELACTAPHLDLMLAHEAPEAVAERIQCAGLRVSALSLFNNFTDPATSDQHIDAAKTFIRLAPLFKTNVVKMTPGPPGSAEAAEAHWRGLGKALGELASEAHNTGVRLAFETHMKQLTDTLSSSRRFLDMAPPDVVGLTVDFSNLAFAGEDLSEAVAVLGKRIVNVHLKNGHVDQAGGWHFQALDDGMTDYGRVLPLLRDAGYDGFLAIECLGPEAQTTPVETARRDLTILERLLDAMDRNAEQSDKQ